VLAEPLAGHGQGGVDRLAHGGVAIGCGLATEVSGEHPAGHHGDQGAGHEPRDDSDDDDASILPGPCDIEGDLKANTGGTRPLTCTSDPSMRGHRARGGSRIVAIAVAFGVVVGLVACGDDGDTTVIDPGTTPTHSPPTSDGAQPVMPEPGMSDDIRSRPFDRAEFTDDGSAVDVYFYGGVQECYVVDRVEVDQSDPAVAELTLFEGVRPGAEVCIEIAVSYVTTVPLDSPVGPEAVVVDGTDGQVKS